LAFYFIVSAFSPTYSFTFSAFSPMYYFASWAFYPRYYFVSLAFYSTYYFASFAFWPTQLSSFCLVFSFMYSRAYWTCYLTLSAGPENLWIVKVFQHSKCVSSQGRFGAYCFQH
jgi:hypothetical protein